MLSVLSFYIFSLVLSYTDCTKFTVPNIIIGTMFIMLLLFKVLEGNITLGNFIVPVIVFMVFYILFLISPNLYIGGGDIKYLMVVGFYMDYVNFPIFMIISGILQTIALIYKQKLKKRRFVAMVPIMFFSVFIVDILGLFNVEYLQK